MGQVGEDKESNLQLASCLASGDYRKEDSPFSIPASGRLNEEFHPLLPDDAQRYRSSFYAGEKQVDLR